MIKSLPLEDEKVLDGCGKNSNLNIPESHQNLVNWLACQDTGLSRLILIFLLLIQMIIAHGEQHGLYDPSFEHDACGIGFVANIKGSKSHPIISDALTVWKIWNTGAPAVVKTIQATEPAL